MRRLLALALLAGALTALGAAHAASAPGRVQVTARDFGFSLSRLTLRPGPAIVQRGMRATLVVQRVNAATAGRPSFRAPATDRRSR